VAAQRQGSSPNGVTIARRRKTPPSTQFRRPCCPSADHPRPGQLSTNIAEILGRDDAFLDLLGAPLLVKVGFYLSDVAPNGGPTLMLEDTDPNAPIPPPTAPPPNMRALAVQAGTAVIFSNRSIHSLRSPNTSDATRRVVFLPYGHQTRSSV
jgi:hypothetical protein